MAIAQNMNIRSILDLIASDMAYSSAQPGALLQSFPDNKPEDESSFPTSLAFQLGREPLTSFQYFEENNVTGVKLPQWEVVKTFETSADGYGALIFKSKARGADGKFDYIVAFRGTDSLDPK